jgi:LacI family transcriptional regulator, repressor for deo operon, udp, cdd, tsx, nupC, and nupG
MEVVPAMPDKKPATIVRVSEAAGVSTATVSRVLHKSDRVSAETRDKVMAAVHKLGYQPDLLARQFRMRRSFTLLITVPDITNPFYSEIIRSAERTASQAGYKVVLGDTESDPEKEDFLTQMLRTKQADGVLHLSSNLPKSLIDMDGKLDSDIAFVNACELINQPGIASVSLDNFNGSKQMAEHLLSLGHSEFALIIGPRSSPLNHARLDGFHAAFTNVAKGRRSVKTIEGDFGIESGAIAARKILASQSLPTAIYCLSDEMALGVIHVLHEAGIDVPGQISVAGFDNTTYAAYSVPPLTTIAQPTWKIGETAMKMLLDLVEQRDRKRDQIVLGGELIIRQSTGPARA